MRHASSVIRIVQNCTCQFAKYIAFEIPRKNLSTSTSVTGLKLSHADYLQSHISSLLGAIDVMRSVIHAPSESDINLIKFYCKHPYNTRRHCLLFTEHISNNKFCHYQLQLHGNRGC